MKSLYSIVFVFCMITLHAQEEELQYMKVDGNNITWQKVYASVLTVEQMKEKFMELDIFESIDSEKDVRIAGTSRVIENDYLSNGLSEKTAEKYLVERDTYGTLIVDFDEGKYRVTLKNIQLKQRFDTRKTPRGSNARLMEYAYDGKKMRWNPDFVANGSAKVINQTLIEAFDIGGKFGGSDF